MGESTIKMLVYILTCVMMGVIQKYSLSIVTATTISGCMGMGRTWPGCMGRASLYDSAAVPGYAANQ